MPPIERRIAAAEAKTQPASSANLRVFIPGRDGDLSAFQQQCKADGVQGFVVRFVRPGDVLRLGTDAVH